MTLVSDYQQFTINDGRVANIGDRMQRKLGAVPLPDLAGKTLLDVGTDFGFWAFLAAERGARHVLGLDRNRHVRGVGHVDLVENNSEVAREYGLPCEFREINLGLQWHEFGKFDVVLCMSMYHHVFQNCGDHDAIWFWLWRHTGEELIWENPVDCSDAVVRINMSPEYMGRYTRGRILRAASNYFDVERIGGAGHEVTREVWRCRPRSVSRVDRGTHVNGAGGATKAFEAHKGRRMDEIETALGVRPLPGSLNVSTEKPFNWSRGYYRFRMLDVRDRGNPVSAWVPRWCRFYPCEANGVRAWAMRFEGEGYLETFVELVSDSRLSDSVKGEVVICH